MFLNCSTYFERHTAHHQELKTVIAAAGFSYVLWLPAAAGNHKTYEKPAAAITVLSY
jgi:hypothetical protein